jgi:hypothetical protein
MTTTDTMDPYEAARMRNRFGNSYGGGQNFQQGSGGMSPAATAGRSPLRQRLPILPDLSEHPSVSPAGQGSSSGFSAQGEAAGAEAQDKLREQIQQSTAARAAQSAAQSAAAQRDPNSAGSPASMAAYRQARDTGIGRDNQVTSGQQRQQATELGIDPSSDAKTIAAAASGKVGFDANGMPTGGDTRQAGPTIAGAGPQPPASTPGNVQPTPGAITNAVQQIQAQKDGAQRLATAQATSTGLGIKSPFSPAAAPQPSTTAPMALRDGTTATAPPPAPVAAPMPAPTFAPAYKLRKPRPGFAGADDTDPASQPA